MKNMETKLKWIGLDEELPPVADEDYMGLATSFIVLITDGAWIFEASYIFGWNKHTPPMDERGAVYPFPWVAFNVNGEDDIYGDEFHYWCDYTNLFLPKKPEIISSTDENKKYTLKQLHQAWGAGFHEGKK